MSFNTPSKKGKSSLIQAPSTTPNVPPPTWLTQKSTTPAGNPPESSRIFGSSFADSTFDNRYARPKGGFSVPESSPPPSDEDEDEDADADAEGEEEDGGMDIGELDRETESPAKSAFLSSIGQSPRGLKRSRNGKPRKPGDGEMAGIARGMVRGLPPAGITESDQFTLRTEETMSRLSHDCQQTPQRADEAVVTAAAQLTRLWTQHGKAKTKEGGIGPATDDPLAEATYLASLLVQTHVPHSIQPSQPPPVARPKRSLAQPKQSASSASSPLPRALLDWLNAHHNPFPDDFNAVHMFQPSPSASDTFWDMVLAELVRGNFTHAVRLLRDAGWENATSAQDDGSAAAGYRGMQLEYAEEVVDRCISVVETCPAVRDDNWDVKGTDWALFRRRVRNAMQDLEGIAKEEPGEDELRDSLAAPKNVFARSNMSLSASTMRANSRVPWTIYENLVHVYCILLGDDAILQVVQDWLEAAILMTVWWDGEDSEAAIQKQSLRQSRRGLNGAGTREVDVAPTSAYRRRLAESFAIAIDEVEDFAIDTLDPIQIGLACILEDDIAGVLGLMRTMSPSVTATIVDLADMGGWLPQSGRSKKLQQEGFSSEDLMVLSHGAGHQKSQSDELVHDEILGSYADMLAERDVFEATNSANAREGWELAVSVLGRLDDKEAAHARVADIFDQMDFEHATRVDKVLELCADMGLGEQARRIAERYADSLASPSLSQHQHRYGSALIYYARAHVASKLKSTLSLLISLCLLHSAVMPVASDMDDILKSLLSKKRTALVDLARQDTEAATLLSSRLSGYATVRRFYELRDQDVSSLSLPTDGGKPLRPLERKRAAASALVTAIESASDCIRGGLFDPDIPSVVPVDGLLALLGEALPLLGLDKRIFTQPQIFSLLRVIEDLDTISASRIRQEGEDLVRAGMRAYRGDGSNVATGKMTWSKANAGGGSGDLSGNSSWDIIASQSTVDSGGRVAGKVEVKRAWDWRKGVEAVVGAEVRSEDVLLLLRTALAREVARGWSGNGGLGW